MISRKWLTISFFHIYCATFGFLFWGFTELIMPAGMVVPWLRIEAPLQEKVDRAMMSPDQRVEKKEEEISRLKSDLLEAEKTIRSSESEKYRLTELNRNLKENYQTYFKQSDNCNVKKNSLEIQNREQESKISFLKTKVEELENDKYIIRNNLLKGKKVLIEFEHGDREKAIGLRNDLIKNGANIEPCLALGNGSNLKINTIYYINGNDVVVAEEIYKLFKNTYDIGGTSPFRDKYMFSNQYDLLVRVRK